MASFLKSSQTYERPFNHPAPRWARAVRQRLQAADIAAVQHEPDTVLDIPGNTVVVGGGPCGLTAAMSLADLGYTNIEVWDSRARPEPSQNEYWGCADRSYNVGLVERGQVVLRKMGGLWESIERCATPLLTRQQWSPQNPDGVTMPSKSDPKTKLNTQVLQRDRLVSCMLEHIDNDYAGKIQVKHLMEVEGMTVGAHDRVSLQWAHKAAEGVPPERGAAEAEFVVAADGAGTTIQTELEKQSLGKVRNIKLKEHPKNTRVYKTIMLPSPEGGDDSNTTFSERSEGGRVLESLPTVEGRSVGLVLFKQDDDEVLSIATEQQAAAFLQKEFPNTFKKMPQSEIKAFVERPPGKLPQFRYCGPELHYSNSVVLAGDAVHTVKPYFGLGVNCAIEDVAVLKRCLEAHPDNRAKALKEYSKERSWDAKVLVQESWRADQGFIYFVGPVILDNMFHKLAPWLFEKSMFTVMSRAGFRIAHVRWRKRLDRVMQFTLIGSALAILLKALIVSVKAAARMVLAAVAA